MTMKHLTSTLCLWSLLTLSPTLPARITLRTTQPPPLNDPSREVNLPGSQITLRKIASTPNLGQLISEMDPTMQRNLVLGNIIKSGLENLHFNKRAVDDKLSAIAFEEYLEILDFGKRFLTETDIRELQKHRTRIDDQVISGRLELLQQAEQRLQGRIKQVRDYVKVRLKHPFTLENKHHFEFDAEKRKWAKNTKELHRLWDNILTVDIINNHLDLEEEQDDSIKDEDGKKKQPDPKKPQKNSVPKRSEKRLSRVLKRDTRASLIACYKKTITIASVNFLTPSPKPTTPIPSIFPRAKKRTSILA